MGKKIAFVIAHQGYHALEYGIPKEILEKNGYTIITVSNKPGPATAQDGSTTSPDLTVNTVDPLHYDAIIFIGGPGALENLDNDASYRLIQKAVMADKVVGGICSATRILAKAGALAAKTATGWDGDKQLKDIFARHAVIHDDQAGVVTDGNIITAEGPSHAESFAHEIMELI